MSLLPQKDLLAALVIVEQNNESFKKITLHDIAKQSNQKNKEKIIEENKKNNLNQSKTSEEEKENIEEKKHFNRKAKMF